MIEVLGIQQVVDRDITIVKGGFGDDAKGILARDIARIHRVELKYINKQINANRNRFKDGVDLIDLFSNRESKDLAKHNGWIGSNRTKNVFLLSASGYAMLSNIMDTVDEEFTKALYEHYFEQDYSFISCLNRKEIMFLDTLEPTIVRFGYTLERQYKVLDYRLDAYIPELNIAIEYDENGHDHYGYKEHEGRQIEIEQAIGCKFIRVSDRISIGDAIAEVLVNILHR